MDAHIGIEPSARVRLRASLSGLAVSAGILALGLGAACAVALTLFQPTHERIRALAFGVMGAGALALCLAVFAGGYVAALTGRAVERRDGVLYGLVVWGVLAGLTLLPSLALFTGVLNNVLSAGAELGVEQAPALGDNGREVMVGMAREAALIFWIAWAGVAAAFGCAVAGGWLGASAQAHARARHVRRRHGALTASHVN